MLVFVLVDTDVSRWVKKKFKNDRVFWFERRKKSKYGRTIITYPWSKRKYAFMLFSYLAIFYDVKRFVVVSDNLSDLLVKNYLEVDFYYVRKKGTKFLVDEIKKKCGLLPFDVDDMTCYDRIAKDCLRVFKSIGDGHE